MLKKVFIIVSLILLFGLQSVAEDFNTYYKNGHKAFDNKNYNLAIDNLEKALNLNSNNYNLYCLLGLSYGMSGNIKKSEEIFSLAVKKFPHEWRAYTFLGDIKRGQHLTPAAIDYYEKAINSPTLPKNYKDYYRKLIDETINEQKEYEKLQVPIVENLNPDITINLDMNKWTVAYLKGNNENWIIEYGLKNEDVVNYKWTKLYTINFFAKNKYNFELKKYYNDFIKLLQQQATNTNRTLYLNKISETSSEIYFEWSISERNECEIDRIFISDKGLYFVHFAQKKKSFTQDEKEQIINVLKSVKIK